MTYRDDPNFHIPPPLQDALHALHPAPSVPPELDDRILFTARDGFARRRRTRLILRRTAAVGGAVAAGVALFFGVQAMQTRPAASPGMPAVVANASTHEGDVDQNGRVDIVDAFVLAKKLETGEVAWVSYEDLDHDGKVTKADVDQVAQLAVRLPDGDVKTGGNVQ